MSIYARLTIIVSVLSLVLFYMVLSSEWVLATGDELILKLAPKDPRSLFRGDYMRLNYEIERLDPNTLAGESQFAVRQTIYVVGETHDTFWVPTALYSQKPHTKGPFLRGEISSIFSAPRGCPEQALCPEQNIDSLQISYGMDSFFIPEGTGLSLEKRVADAGLDKIQVHVRVGADGRGMIKSFLIDEERIYENRLF